MKKAVFYLLFMCSVLAQAQRPLGTWRSFTPFGAGRYVIDAGDLLYCASSQAIFTVEWANGNVTPIQKSNGLSDAGIRCIGYHATKKALIIAYNSSNIDVLMDNKIYNIPDLKNKITGSAKNINNISIVGAYAYLATDLGVSVLDLDKKEFRNTYVIGNDGGTVRINDITADATTLYAATDQGLKAAPIQGVNLQDFAQWKLIGEAKPCALVCALGNEVWAVASDTLFRKTGNTLTKVRYNFQWKYNHLTTHDGYLYATAQRDSGGVIYEGHVLQIDATNTIRDLKFQDVLRPNVCFRKDGKYVIADSWVGCGTWNDQYNRTGWYGPNSPPSNGNFNMQIVENELYVATGGTDPAYIGLNYNNDGPVLFTNNEWKSYSPRFFGSIEGCRDLVDVAVTSTNKIAYFASLQGGLVEMIRDPLTLNKYDFNNSILKETYPGTSKVSALALDKNNNLWMSNVGTQQSLKLKTADGQWAAFAVPNDLTTTRQMLVDSRGWLWMTGRGNTINVYDPGENLLSPTDDRHISLGSGKGNGALPNNNVYCIVEDKNNDIWVGTDEGIGTFYCARNIFSNGCDADKIKVERDGFIGYLFATEIVRAMAVDGANRKWVGTTNGVWLISADGKEELLKFNKDNSPMPANGVIALEVNQQTGEVFIGTEEGLVSYQGDAILGGEKAGEALVYPNPVNKDYVGPIAIKGLVDDAYVKIMDAGGTLVHQGKANGGQFVWDGKTYNGNRVSTGVYVVYAATTLGAERSIAKIVFQQ